MSHTSSSSSQDKKKAKATKHEAGQKVTPEEEITEQGGFEIDIDQDPMGLDREMAIRQERGAVNDINPDKSVTYDHDVDIKKVAKTLNEFQNMITQAKMSGVKEIEATVDVHKYFQKHNYKPGVGFMMYSDIMVFEEGQREAVLSRLGRTMEQVLFGGSKVGISEPIMEQKKV